MSTKSSNIDPTDPLFSHHAPTEQDDWEILQNGFHRAQEHFPKFMDITVTLQILQDLSDMADLRFRTLFSSVREDLVAAAERYDQEHPVVERHQPQGTSALPNWEAVIGFSLDEGLLVDEDALVERAHQYGPVQQAVNMAAQQRPVINSVDLTALYHSYHPTNDECEIVCSYIDEEFINYDYCMFIRQVDLRDFNVPPLYLLDTDSYRYFLIELLEAKIQALFDAEQTHDVEYVFEGYVAPLVYILDDFRRTHRA